MTLIAKISTLFGTSERRQHERFTVPAPLIVVKSGKRGVRYRAVDWSVDGFKLEKYHEKVKADDTLEGRIEFANGPQGTFVAKVVYTQSDGSLGTQFLELSPAEFLYPVKESS